MATRIWETYLAPRSRETNKGFHLLEKGFMDAIFKTSSRFTPRPTVGTIWVIMSGSSWTVDFVKIAKVFWDDDPDSPQWYVIANSARPGNSYMCSADVFWGYVEKVNLIQKKVLGP